MSYEFTNQGLVSADGPLDYEWESEEAALKLAGYRKATEIGPAPVMSYAIIYRREEQKVSLPWDYEFIFDYSLCGDTYDRIYCRRLPDLLGLLRYVEPVTRMLIQSLESQEQESLRLDKVRRENPMQLLSNEEKRKQKADREARDQRELAATRQKWEEYLAGQKQSHAA